MARADIPIAYTKWSNEDGTPSKYFFQLVLSLWERTGSSQDIDLTTFITNITLSSTISRSKAKTIHQDEVSADYTITGSFDLEIITTTNSSTSITITMPNHYEGAEVIVNRGGVGGVTVSGGGTNILGLASQSIPFQHDSAHFLGKSAEWGLI